MSMPRVDAERGGRHDEGADSLEEDLFICCCCCKYNVDEHVDEIEFESRKTWSKRALVVQAFVLVFQMALFRMRGYAVLVFNTSAYNKSCPARRRLLLLYVLFLPFRFKKIIFKKLSLKVI